MLKVILSCSFFCNQRKKEYFCHERKLLAYRINKMIWNPNKECMSRDEMKKAAQNCEICISQRAVLS